MGGRQAKATTTKGVMAMAIRVAGNNEGGGDGNGTYNNVGNGDSIKGGRHMMLKLKHYLIVT
jgi:hypothetical protein